MKFGSSLLLSSLVLALATFFVGASNSHAADGCNAAPTSSLVVNVRDRGAKGDGKTNVTPQIQKAIDEVAGTGGTVYVPDGVYMVTADGAASLQLKSKMTLKLANGAILKAIPNGANHYSVLRIAEASDVIVTGGTLMGDRAEHQSKGGEWGMGIRIGPNVARVTIAGVTAKEMWGDGFYVEGATDVAFCSVIATHNRRQGLSIIEADRLLVTKSVFQQTRGTRPSAGIDIEPDKRDQKAINIRIEHSKFINNAGGGVMIAGKRGHVADVEIVRNVFEEDRPILIENAPHVRSTAICDNRLIGRQEPSQEGLNSFRRDRRSRVLADRLPERTGFALRNEPGEHEEEEKEEARQLSRQIRCEHWMPGPAGRSTAAKPPRLGQAQRLTTRGSRPSGRPKRWPCCGV